MSVIKNGRLGMETHSHPGSVEGEALQISFFDVSSGATTRERIRRKKRKTQKQHLVRVRETLN